MLENVMTKQAEAASVTAATAAAAAVTAATIAASEARAQTTFAMSNLASINEKRMDKFIEK